MPRAKNSSDASGFAAMEAAAADSGVPLEQRTLAQMQPLWQQAKQTASADNEGKKSARQ